MSLDVIFGLGGYRVSVSPPHAKRWDSKRLLTGSEVLEELSARGCHSADITDALYAANPTWTQTHDAEVRRRREEELRAILSEPTDDGPESQDR